MKRVLLVLGALLATVVVVISARQPADPDPSTTLAAPTGPAATSRTVDLGDGWFADVSSEGGLPCVVLRNDVAQSPTCVGSSVAVGAFQYWTQTGRGVRLSVALAGSTNALTAQWSSRQFSGAPCCLTEVPMIEIEPDVWLTYLASADEDQHWGVQLRTLGGGLYKEVPFIPPT